MGLTIYLISEIYDYVNKHISSCKFFVYFARKNLFFLFYTYIFTKHSYQFVYFTIYII